VAQKMAKQVMSLPMSAELQPEQQQRIMDALVA
jgi:dTDP-4-amino-4,6-dideoxygalactose transaminase